MAEPKKREIKQARKLKATPGDRFSNVWFSVLILASITFVVYARSLSLDYTKLDDSIFIVENAPYNADAHNLIVSFQRGLFNPTKDAYYRPMFLVDFILESRLFGTSPAGYHFSNLIFHILSVILLFFFLQRLKIPPANAFLLSLIFAVHPVLTQAVAWIPGRNDMLLMILFFSSFILLFQYLDTGSPWRLLWQGVLFLAALFTKETAIIIPVVIGGILLFYIKPGWKKIALPAATWIGAVLIWLLVRSTATLEKNWIAPSEMLRAGLERLGVILQYLGKIFFPVNLSVFPMAEDITLVWGIVALAGLIALIVWSKSWTKPLTWLGLAWFLIFLVPVLIVPKSLNDQVFEHRLYIPIIGILMMLSQAFPFTGNVNPKLKFGIVGAIALLFSIQSIVRSGYFNDPVTFWTHAVEGSPHSAYAKALLGTKIDDPAIREKWFREARAIDPELKNLNYYLGKVLYDQNAIDSADFYLRKEVVHNQIPDAWFLLARIAFMREQFDSAAVYLEKVIELNPNDSQANHNLALLYFQHGKPEKSKKIIADMQARGMEVGDLLQMVNGK